MKTFLLRRPLAVVLALALLPGCVSVSRREGAANIEQLLAPRLPGAFQWRNDEAGGAAMDARAAEITAAPLTPASAFQLAQLRNPAIAVHYAELGIAQAYVVQASRIGNPGFSASTLNTRPAHQVTLGLSVALTDLLLLPVRRRFAEAEYERAQYTMGAALMNLAADTAEDWYAAAGADQVAAMREAVAVAAAASAELAQRFHAAGNISALELKLEQAGASQARIAATTARAAAQRARLTLNTRMGLSGSEAARWRFDLPLAAPVADEDDLATLQTLAHEQRLDLAAARREVDLLDDALGLARRWRLLGRIEVGVEREKEADGSRVSGPTLALALPLFDQGQAAIARAEAQLERSRAVLAGLELSVDAEVRLGVERVAALRAITQDYRDALIPQREAVVARQTERLNYMLIGAFELLLARQQEYDAYQGYLESVRDYWQARVALARAIGTRLPSDAQATGRALGVEAVLTPAAEGHGAHGQHGAAQPPDPPAGHGAADGEAGTSDHAGHSRHRAATPADAHTGHDHADMSTGKDDQPPRATHETLKAEPPPTRDDDASHHHDEHEEQP
jgi:cobalt-zinc-cadmium efflux system outer membrane protein